MFKVSKPLIIEYFYRIFKVIHTRGYNEFLLFFENSTKTINIAFSLKSCKRFYINYYWYLARYSASFTQAFMIAS